MQQSFRNNGYVPLTHHTLDDAIAANGGCLSLADSLKLEAPNGPVVTAINPSHYRSHPSGIECIQITQHMGFNLGNAVKYIWRCDLKRDAIEDLKKAKWYIEREIAKREAKGV